MEVKEANNACEKMKVGTATTTYICIILYRNEGEKTKVGDLCTILI